MSTPKLYPAGHSIQHLFMGVLALTFSGGAAARHRALVASTCLGEAVRRRKRSEDGRRATANQDRAGLVGSTAPKAFGAVVRRALAANTMACARAAAGMPYTSISRTDRFRRFLLIEIQTIRLGHSFNPCGECIKSDVNSAISTSPGTVHGSP